MTVPTETETDTARPAAPTQHLTDALTTLHLARAYAAAADDEVAEIRRQFDVAHEERLDDQVAAREALKRAETLVRELTLAHYQVTREARPIPGVDAIARAVDTVRAAFLSDTAAINRPDHVAGLPIHWLQESLDRAAARAAA